MHERSSSFRNPELEDGEREKEACERGWPGEREGGGGRGARGRETRAAEVKAEIFTVPAFSYATSRLSSFLRDFKVKRPPGRGGGRRATSLSRAAVNGVREFVVSRFRSSTEHSVLRPSG